MSENDIVLLKAVPYAGIGGGGVLAHSGGGIIEGFGLVCEIRCSRTFHVG